MKKTFKFLVLLFPLFFGIAIFIFFDAIYPYHLHYQEQFQLFQFTSAYCLEVISTPGGFSDYISQFLSQFYFYSWSGALIIALSLIGLQQLLQAVASRFAVCLTWVPLTYLPSVFYWYLLCDDNYLLNGLVALILSLSGLIIGLCFHSNKVRRIYLFIMIPFFYWIAGGVICLFVAGILLYDWLKKKESWQTTIIISIISLLMVIACPFVAKYFWAQYQLYRFWWGGTYVRFTMHQPEMIPYLWTLIVINFFIFAFLPESKKDKTCLIIFSFNTTVLLFVSVFVIKEGYTVNEWKEELMEYDYHCRMKQWEEVIKMANKKSPDISMSVTCLNLALHKTGQLPEKMFHYFQNGTEGLLPTFQRDFMLPLVSSEVYYYLGFINTAQRFTFEAMESLPDYQKSARCIKRLVETNLINAQYEVAAKYLDILRHTLFYRAWAEETMIYLNDEARISTHPEWGVLRQYRLQNDFLFSEGEKDMMLGILFQHNLSNRMAYEYLLAYTLLSKDLKHFWAYYTMDGKKPLYNVIPKSFQEALTYIWSQSQYNPSLQPQGVDNDVVKLLEKYRNIYITQPGANRILAKEFSNTYWYYYHYNK
jgi:hypothetical protein